MNISAGAYSSKGSVRPLNEDSFLLGEETGGTGVDDTLASFNGNVMKSTVFAVADGMGGHSAGDKASQFVVQQLLRRIQNIPGINSAVLEETIKSIHADLLKEAARINAPNMGSTLTGLVLQNGNCGFFNAGDSRVYRLRNGFLQQLSRDDSLSAIVPGAAKNIITNALGAGLPTVTVESRFSANIAVPGDIFFLCSDGVHGAVYDEVLEKMLLESGTPEEITYRIVKQAIANNSDDNCTALVVKLMDGE
ncbi:serine/threonine-protein phosphatase [Treponema primitia]|uniref:PP2C family protein-serine/threonine phosphatase n=1 Tax=Treponema primitia TaxID=88058 RepID=UPI0039815630